MTELTLSLTWFKLAVILAGIVWTVAVPILVGVWVICHRCVAKKPQCKGTCKPTPKDRYPYQAYEVSDLAEEFNQRVMVEEIRQRLPDSAFYSEVGPRE